LMKGEDLPLEKRSQSTETDFKRVRPPWGLWVRRYDKRKESNGTFLKSFSLLWPSFKHCPSSRLGSKNPD
jgi:hypothetical protein